MEYQWYTNGIPNSTTWYTKWYTIHAAMLLTLALLPLLATVATAATTTAVAALRRRLRRLQLEVIPPNSHMVSAHFTCGSNVGERRVGWVKEYPLTAGWTHNERIADPT